MPESPQKPAEPRKLSEDEFKLIHFLLSSVWSEEQIAQGLASVLVMDMKDGGMGSIRFVGAPGRKMGKVAVEARYTDSDKIPVLISINLDEEGRLFELDFWKVDFSPLKRYPKTTETVVEN
jgi:hypothetical protein